MAQKAEEGRHGLDVVLLRPALVALVFLTLLVSSAQAAPPQPNETQLADPGLPLRAWRANNAQVMMAVAVDGFDTGFVNLARLGDLDGDGRDEVLLFEQESTLPSDDEAAQLLRVTALAPLAQESAWTMEASADQFLDALGDVDGDGIQDLMAFGLDDFVIGFGNTVPLPLPVFAYDLDYSFDLSATVHSGRDTATLADLRATFASRSTNAQAFVAVVGAFAAQGSDVAEEWAFGANRTFLLAQEHYNATYAQVSAVVLGTGVEVRDYDGAYTLRGLDGRLLAAKDVVGPTRTPLGAGSLARASADPLLVTAWREGPEALQAGLPLQPASLHVEATDDDGAVWSVASDPQPAFEAELLGLPDLTGDGTGELELVLTALQAPDLLAPSFTTTLYDGATGTMLATTTSTESILYFIPFGDLDADGRPELLSIRVGLDEESVLVGPTGLDLRPRWERDVSAAFPLNFDDSEFGLLNGFADWTGDGAPDLALQSDGLLELVDGPTGDLVWDRTLTEDQEVWTLGEVTGRGAGDLALVSVTGVTASDEDATPDGSQATAQYAIVAGESGKAVRTQTVRDPLLAPAGPAGTDVWVVDVGDVDGDGRDDFGVVVTDFTAASRMMDGEPILYLERHPTAYIFSVGRAAPLWSHDAALQAPADADLPSAQIAPSAKNVAPNEASGLPALAGLLVLGLLAGARRR